MLLLRYDIIDVQNLHIIKNLRSPNEVRGNNRRQAVIEDTLIILHPVQWFVKCINVNGGDEGLQNIWKNFKKCLTKEKSRDII